MSNKPLIIPKLGGAYSNKSSSNSNNNNNSSSNNNNSNSNSSKNNNSSNNNNNNNISNSSKIKPSYSNISKNNDKVQANDSKIISNTTSTKIIENTTISEKKPKLNNSNPKKAITNTANTTNTTNNNNTTSKTKTKATTTNNWWTVNDAIDQPIISKLADDTKWYSILNDIDNIDDSNKSQYPLSQITINDITTNIEKIYNNEVTIYQKNKKTSNDSKWINDVIKSGTLSDKVAALALSVQDSPLHNLETFDLLIAMASKKEQRPAQLALEALKDLLIHNILPDRKLKPFLQQSLGHPKMNIQIALSYWYEGQLINRIEAIVRSIETGLTSQLEYFKKICMQLAAELLVNKPEQEAKLLNMLVNKLGDSKGSIYSKCMEILRNLLRKHPNMKPIVVREIRQLIFKPSAPPRLVYNGIIFLSNIHLSQRDSVTAAALVESYVSLFERAIGQDELGSKLLAALLTGVNRAFPYLADVGALAKHTDALFRLVHKGSFAASVQALVLISHIAIGDTSNKSNETNENTKNSEQADKLINRFYRALYAKLLDNQISTKGRNTMFLNLLFRSLKNDPSDDRCMAFIKRLCMSALQSSAPIGAGLLYMISEIVSTRQSLLPMMTEIEEISMKINDNDDNDSDNEDSTNICQLGNYNASKREPEFANSGQPSLWEMSLLRMHYHPSVRAFATSLLDPPHQISYSGDPTVEFTLPAFLNQFAYKNPKTKTNINVKRATATVEEPLNTSLFKNLDTKDVAPEKLFFHKYFGERERLLQEGKMRNRSKKKVVDEDEDEYDEGDDKNDNDGNFSEAGSDAEEAEIDKFATKLALDLMKNQAGGEGPDIDDDFSFSDDDDDDDDDAYDYGDAKDDDELFDDEEDDDFPEGDFAEDDDNDEKDLHRMKKKKRNDPESDDDDDDNYDLQAYGDDDEDDEEDEDKNNKKKSSSSLKRKSKEPLQKEPKKKKSSLSSSSSSGLGDFASAEDYETMMEENVKKFVKK